MSAHAHTLHHGAPLAVAAQTALEASGEQWTDMRSRVFDALAGFDRPASAYDIGFTNSINGTILPLRELIAPSGSSTKLYFR